MVAQAADQLQNLVRHSRGTGIQWETDIELQSGSRILVLLASRLMEHKLYIQIANWTAVAEFQALSYDLV